MFELLDALEDRAEEPLVLGLEVALLELCVLAGELLRLCVVRAVLLDGVLCRVVDLVVLGFALCVRVEVVGRTARFDELLVLVLG